MEEVQKEEVLEKQGSQVKQEFQLHSYYAVTQVRSIRRSMKRGKVTPFGLMAPKRPYNNRANTSERINAHSRVNNIIKRNLYDRVK